MVWYQRPADCRSLMSRDNFIYDFTLAASDYKALVYDYVENGYSPPTDPKDLGAWLVKHEKEKIKKSVFLKRFRKENHKPADKIYYDFKLGWVLERKDIKAFLGKALLPLGAKIKLGHCSYFSGRSWIRGKGTLEVGNFVCIANNCVIDTSPREHPKGLPAHINWSTNPRVNHIGLAIDCYTDSQESEVHIGNDVWLGEMTTLKSGVTIGDGSVVGRAGLVLKDIPRYEIWGGVPAKKIRDRFCIEEKNKFRLMQWWYFTDKELRKHKVFFKTPV